MSSPDQQRESAPPPLLPAIPIAYGKLPLQFGEFYLSDGPGPHPVVILIHGGFWRAPYSLVLMNGLAQSLAQQGIATWNIEYRRVGDPGGGWPGTLQDVGEAADHLYKIAPTYNLDLAHVVAIGHSADGHLALWLAARSQLDQESPLAPTDVPLKLSGVISQAGAADLEHVWRLKLSNNAAADLLGGNPDEFPQRYADASPAAHLPLGIPQVFIHGTNDNLVPLEISEAYAQKASAAGDTTHLITLPGADHFVLIDPTSEAWNLTILALKQLLNAS